MSTLESIARIYNVPDGCDIDQFGRQILDPSTWSRNCPEVERRQKVLIETLLAFGTQKRRAQYRQIALGNVKRWKEHVALEKQAKRDKFLVIPGDWGEVALKLTRTHGTTFAVLNMANPYSA